MTRSSEACRTAESQPRVWRFPSYPSDLPVRQHDALRRPRLREPVQNHPEIGPVDPVPGPDEAKVGVGIVGLASDRDPAYALDGGRAMEQVEQALERGDVPGHQLQYADFVLGSARSERGRMPE